MPPSPEDPPRGGAAEGPATESTPPSRRRRGIGRRLLPLALGALVLLASLSPLARAPLSPAEARVAHAVSAPLLGAAEPELLGVEAGAVPPLLEAWRALAWWTGILDRPLRLVPALALVLAGLILLGAAGRMDRADRAGAPTAWPVACAWLASPLVLVPNGLAPGFLVVPAAALAAGLLVFARGGGVPWLLAGGLGGGLLALSGPVPLLVGGGGLFLWAALEARTPGRLACVLGTSLAAILATGLLERAGVAFLERAALPGLGPTVALGDAGGWITPEGDGPLARVGRYAPSGFGAGLALLTLLAWLAGLLRPRVLGGLVLLSLPALGALFAAGPEAFGWPALAPLVVLLIARGSSALPRPAALAVALLFTAGAAGKLLVPAPSLVSDPRPDLERAARHLRSGGRLVLAGGDRHQILHYARRGHHPGCPILLVPEEVPMAALPAHLREALGVERLTGRAHPPVLLLPAPLTLPAGLEALPPLDRDGLLLPVRVDPRPVPASRR